MKKILLFALATLPWMCASAQYCNSGGPTAEIDSNIESVTLTGATGSINYTGCPGITGLEEYLSETVFLNAGEQYSLEVQFGTCGNNYAGAGEVWIDYNGDGVFDLSESIGVWAGTPPVALSTFLFTVPPGVVNSLVRMRINQQETATTPLDPCASFSWGSSTDFSLYLQNGVDCSGYVGDEQSDPRVVNTLPYNESYNSAVCYTNQNPVYNAPDIYYLILLNGEEAIDVSLCGSSFDTFLSVMKTDGEIIAINDDYNGCGTSSQLSVVTSGLDSIYVIVDGWGVQSGDYEIDISSLDLGLEKSIQKEVIIYPNPSSDIIYFKDLSPNTKVSLLNTAGQVVSNFGAVEKVAVSSYEKGVYFILFESGNVKVSKKIVIL